MDLITEHRQQADTDHVMVYLSRNPGTSSAFIKWKFNFNEAGMYVRLSGLVCCTILMPGLPVQRLYVRDPYSNVSHRH